jgi:hypothetical protein
MTQPRLPEHASIEYLRKLAKERLRELRLTDPQAKLAAAQLEIARGLGFPSWRALKAEIDRRQRPASPAFFTACRAGDVERLRELLDERPELVRERDADGSTGLHAAVAHLACVRLLLERGADPDARDAGDNASPLHFAAGYGHAETVRALLDAGADPHGNGDVHDAEVIGWAAGNPTNVANGVIPLLLARGAKHHIFSAITLGDQGLVRAVVREDPAALRRRRSRFEHHQTPLHFALAEPEGLGSRAPMYDMADLLIELGADVNATDGKGRTPLEVAMLHGDIEAMRRLKSAGAKEPAPPESAGKRGRGCALEDSMRRLVPMLCVEDVDATVEWYSALGFTIAERQPPSGPIGWAYLTFGKMHLMVQHMVKRPRAQIALWFYTAEIEELYGVFKARQFEAAKAAMSGASGRATQVQFFEDLYEPHYGGRQFSVRDPNGFELVFMSA